MNMNTNTLNQEITISAAYEIWNFNRGKDGQYRKVFKTWDLASSKLHELANQGKSPALKRIFISGSSENNGITRQIKLVRKWNKISDSEAEDAGLIGEKLYPDEEKMPVIEKTIKVVTKVLFVLGEGWVTGVWTSREKAITDCKNQTEPPYIYVEDRLKEVLIIEKGPENLIGFEIEYLNEVKI